MSNTNIIKWTSRYMLLKLIGAVLFNLIPIILFIIFDYKTIFFALYTVAPLPLFLCVYEIFYLSKCSICFGNKTITIKRPLHSDVEYPLLEVKWSAVQIGLGRGCDIYIHRGSKKIMRITDSWDNYDILMTFPHLHLERSIEKQLIKRRNDRLKNERKYKI